MKQVIVVNEELNLPRGKLAAQVAHASIASLFLAEETHRHLWFEDGMPKIVLAGDNPAHLAELFEKCQALDLPAYLVKDGGKTVIAPGTITCLGIGPASAELVDQVSGALKLLT